ncbi:MAG: NACHT domain-containing protein [Myxococcaceae bacterium]|nr:NACHT domain-containing protein [Myxococcaceae bacterium]
MIGAELYGTAGQGQEGIDLYARLANPAGYRVYQCKKVNELMPSDIKKAVKRFTDGSWAKRARELVLCTTDELRTTERLETFEAEREKLAKIGVSLIPWACSNISEKLKNHPLLVHDFFGQPWVERFCGAAAAASMVNRLSPVSLADLRIKLGRLYRNVFSAHDPGLHALLDERPTPLRERFIVPDVLESDPIALAARQEPAVPPAGTSNAPVDVATAQQDAAVAPGASRSDSLRVRVPLFSHFAGSSNARQVILGGPGSGKSTLLRFIALDLLSEFPREAQLAQLWGTRLPVWIPFGAWVDRIQRGDQQTPLTEVVRTWLEQWGEGDFFPLVEAALRDKRLLLLVDGLDEWSSQDAARIALTRLQVFVEQADATALVTSRPDGFKQIAGCLQGWKAVDLAALSHAQQVDLAHRWFSKLADADSPTGSAQSLSRAPLRQAQEAIEAISRLPDAQLLAEVPLLLSALLLLKVQNVDLPSDRFRAYAQLTHQLMFVHPSRRRTAAQTQTSSMLRESDLEQAFANLAFRTHSDSPSGLFSQLVAQQHLERALTDDEFGIGYAPQDAKRLAREMVNIGESVSGVLVRRSPNELGFFHRSIQEHLVAVHVAAMPQQTQLELIGTHAGNPQWREVVLALLVRSQSRDLVEKAVQTIEGKLSVASPMERLQLTELLAEIASGPSPCPIQTRRRVLDAAADLIEQSWSRDHRKNLLAILLDGLSIQSVRSSLLPKLQLWFPERVWIRDSLLRSLTDWPDHEAWDHLSFALQGDSLTAQLTAAMLISQRWRGDVAALDRLRSIIKSPVAAMTKAAVMKAWLDGWEASQAFHDELDADGAELCTEMQLVKLLAAVKVGDRSNETRDKIAGCINYDGADYAWHDTAAAALVQHWRGDPGLRDLCIASINRSVQSEPVIDFQHAWSILFAAFPGDDVVADLLIHELDAGHQSFGSVDWSHLAQSFRDHPALTARLEKWIADSGPMANTRMAGAALVGRTPSGKAALLNLLSGHLPFWSARGLLDGWGMSDPEVAEALTARAWGENNTAASIAHLLPRVIQDPARCYARLLELLRDREARRVDFVMSGLDALGRVAEVEVVNAALERLDGGQGYADGFVAEMLIQRAAHNPAVRSLALNALRWAEPPYAVVAAGFAADSEMRALVARALRPLPQSFRHFIAHRLEESTPPGEDIASICEDYRGERLIEVATAAAIVTFRNRAALGSVGEDRIEYLRSELSCYGPSFERRRQAAYAAALEIGKPTLIDELNERIGEPTKLQVGLGDSIEANVPLIRQVLERWESLQTLYPDAVLSRLGGHRSSSARTDADADDHEWSRIAGHADSYPLVRSRLDRYLSERSAGPLPPPLLRYFSRLAPRSQRLRDWCLEALNAENRGMFRPLELEQTAVDILVSQFHDDDALWESIAKGLPEQPWSIQAGNFVALARARPEHPKTVEVAKAVVQHPQGHEPYLVFQALCCVADTKRLYDRTVYYWGPTGRDIGAWLYRPLVERLRRDETVLRKFQGTIASERISTRVSVCVALAAAAPLPPILVTGLVDLLKEELAGLRVTSYAFDPRSGTIEPAAALLAELLSGAALV